MKQTLDFDNRCDYCGEDRLNQIQFLSQREIRCLSCNAKRIINPMKEINHNQYTEEEILELMGANNCLA